MDSIRIALCLPIKMVNRLVSVSLSAVVSFSSHPDAQDWLHTVWLGIEEDFQGQGLGRYLLQYALQEMKEVGYKHAAISTAWDNHRAFLFYSNCGYRTVDWTYGFVKNLSETPTPAR